MTKADKVTLCDNKELKTLRIAKMIVYLRSKIIEAWDDRGQVYYLFFYKDTFLTACKAKRLRIRSFIADAIKKGISLASPHPIIRKVVHSSQSYRTFEFKQLLKKLRQEFSPYEQAYILTFFESFIHKRELFEKIQEIYYDLRRNGQMFSSYQTSRILHEFAPKNKWARETANLISFSKYFNLYHKFSEQLLARDVIYGEKLLYEGRENRDFRERLEHSLLDDGLVMDAAVLAIDDFLAAPEVNRYKTLLERLQMVFSEEEVCEIVEDLYLQKPELPMLQNDLLERLLKLDRLEDAAKLIARREIPPAGLSEKALNAVGELILSGAGGMQYEKMNVFLAPLVFLDPEKAEKAIEKCVTYLLKEYDIDYVENWLEPIKEADPFLAIFQKIDCIKKYQDDPDKQLELGKIYYDLDLLELALNCFSWEMEMNEKNLEPVEWLAKLYKKMGMERESEAYLYLLENEQFYTKHP